MTQISSLLAEAKPLYLKRKHQKNIVLKSSALGLMLLIVTPFLHHSSSASLNGLYRDLYDNDFFALTFEEEIPESVFPTDEYGLVKMS